MKEQRIKRRDIMPLEKLRPYETWVRRGKVIIANDSMHQFYGHANDVAPLKQ